MINKIFLDMDGVIVNFRGQCEKNNCIEGHNVDWSIVRKGGPEFWETMEWIPESKDFFTWLVNLCNEEDIELYILSATNLPDGKVGKLNWLKKHTDINRHHIIITNTGKEKGYYAEPGSLLIDDFGKNCDIFIQNGGNAIKFKTSNIAKEEILKLVT